MLAPQDVHQRDRPDNADQMIRLVDHRHGSHLVVQRDRCRLLLVRVGCDPWLQRVHHVAQDRFIGKGQQFGAPRHHGV